MSIETIEKIIDRLNQKDFEGVFLEILSKTVEHGIVWQTNLSFGLEGKSTFKTRDEFYFIKDFDKYIGAVLIMKQNGGDLHWFVKKEYRKKGNLTKALAKYILPHLFIEKNEQRITIDEDLIGRTNFENSKKVALNVGFSQKSEDEFVITDENILRYETNSIRKKGMSYNRLEELQRKVISIEKELHKIQDEFEYHMGKISEFDELRIWLKEVRRDTMELKHSEYQRNDKN